MKKKKFFIVVLVFILVGGFLFLIISGLGKPKLAGLMVQSNSVSSIFLDGKKVGVTPYNGTFNSGEVAIQIENYQAKINLEAGIKTVIERAKINLEAGIKTVIERDFDISKNSSSGEIISFEKIGGSETSLAVVTDPDSAVVNLDNISRGAAPLKIDGLTAGTHSLSISINGYTTRNFSINLIAGYKLIAAVDLSPVAPKTVPEQKQNNATQVFVKILDTPNGFLRVRSDPTTASFEIAQVHAEEKYELIKIDPISGWYDIRLTATSSGWISNTYAVKD